MTAEELFMLPYNQKHFLNAFGDWRKEPFAITKFEEDIAKTKNYKDNYFYHATGGFGESGVGKGLYLGKDRFALNNFYNCGGEEGEILTYYGAPNFIDLTDEKDLINFKKDAYRFFKSDDCLEKYTLKNGFDGIRYYDIETTGEEFVLFNTGTVKIMEEN